jgi:hypothetical protein
VRAHTIPVSEQLATVILAAADQRRHCGQQRCAGCPSGNGQTNDVGEGRSGTGRTA